MRSPEFRQHSEGGKGALPPIVLGRVKLGSTDFGDPEASKGANPSSHQRFPGLETNSAAQRR
eukprot:12885465-Alexandrium_andersonii.AAC.1